MEKYQELKTGKKISFIIYGLSADKKNIEVLKVSEDRDFDAFVAELPEKDSRYAVLDFEYDLEGDGKRSKILFVQWSVPLLCIWAPGPLMPAAGRPTRLPSAPRCSLPAAKTLSAVASTELQPRSRLQTTARSLAKSVSRLTVRPVPG